MDTEKAKAEMKKMIEAAPKRLVRVDSALHVFVGETDAKVEAAIQKFLKEGKTVSENGSTRWIEFFADFDTEKSGSACYTWKGDKVRGERFLFTKTGDKTERKSLGVAWRNFENA